METWYPPKAGRLWHCRHLSTPHSRGWNRLSNRLWTGILSRSTRRLHVRKGTSLVPKLAILKLISLASLASLCFWSNFFLTPGVKPSRMSSAVRLFLFMETSNYSRGAVGRKPEMQSIDRGVPRGFLDLGWFGVGTNSYQPAAGLVHPGGLGTVWRMD